MFVLKLNTVYIFKPTMQECDLPTLFFSNFDQSAVVSASTKSTSATTFSRKFKTYNYKTENEFIPLLDTDILTFLKTSLPDLTANNRQIGTRSSKFITSKIIGHDTVQYGHAKRLDSFTGPVQLENQQFGLYVVYEDFKENTTTDTKPTKHEISCLKLKKLERLTSTDLSPKICLLFEEPIKCPDSFPEGIESDVSSFFQRNGFTTRTNGDKVRIDFNKDDWSRAKTLYERFEKASFKVTPSSNFPPP